MRLGNGDGGQEFRLTSSLTSGQIYEAWKERDIANEGVGEEGEEELSCQSSS